MAAERADREAQVSGLRVELQEQHAAAGAAQSALAGERDSLTERLAAREAVRHRRSGVGR